jgi:hypothetical protein
VTIQSKTPYKITFFKTSGINKRAAARPDITLSLSQDEMYEKSRDG